MRVLMFGWEFPPFITGGLGTACYGLSQELARIVERIVFVVPRLGQDQSEQSEFNVGGVNLKGATQTRSTPKQARRIQSYLQKFEKVVIDSPLRPYMSAENYEFWQGNKFENAALFDIDASQSVIGGNFTGDYGQNLLEEVARYAVLASSIAETEKFDVIHAHDWMTFPAGVAAKRISGLPLIVHIHALEFDRSGENIDQRVYDLERFGMEHADLIVAVSNRTKETIVRRYGIAPQKIKVLHNGITDLLPSTPIRRHRVFDEKVVVFLGRITMQKGPEYFLEAASLVSKHLPGARFVMAGVGDMLPRMILLMASKRLNLNFHFTGFISEKMRSHLFSIADLFVMTSVSEPFGLTPIEAAQHDVPVIIPHQSGVSEVMSHAVKVDFWDTHRIADAIINVLESPHLSQQMITGSRKEIKGRSWSHAARVLNNYYQEVV